MLDKHTKLFFAGIITAFIISILEALADHSHPENPLIFFIFSVSFAGYIVKFSYFVILIIILPFVAIPKLKKKLGPKSTSVYVFAAGITLWGAIEGIAFLLSR
jgi:hypothetical protein